MCCVFFYMLYLCKFKMFEDSKLTFYPPFVPATHFYLLACFYGRMSHHEGHYSVPYLLDYL